MISLEEEEEKKQAVFITLQMILHFHEKDLLI